MLGTASPLLTGPVTISEFGAGSVEGTVVPSVVDLTGGLEGQ
jgi:hypothetical protein